MNLLGKLSNNVQLVACKPITTRNVLFPTAPHRFVAILKSPRLQTFNSLRCSNHAWSFWMFVVFCWCWDYLLSFVEVRIQDWWPVCARFTVIAWCGFLFFYVVLGLKAVATMFVVLWPALVCSYFYVLYSNQKGRHECDCYVVRSLTTLLKSLRWKTRGIQVCQ